MEARLKESDVVDLLAAKHSKDVFVPQCKNGPSYGAGLRLMDAWTMKRSWANPCYYGYEIKLSRGDFLADDKWPEYLPLCNEFSFVCPEGVIKTDELPKEVGLLVTSKNGKRLFTRKKAPHRQIEPPVLVLEYILMARCCIVGTSYYEEVSKDEYWRRWLQDKKSKLELGTRCGEKLHESYKSQVHDVQHENKILKSQIEVYAEVKRLCEELGISKYGNWRLEKTLKEQWEKVHSILPPEFISKCNKLQKQLAAFIKLVEQGSEDGK